VTLLLVDSIACPVESVMCATSGEGASEAKCDLSDGGEVGSDMVGLE